MAQALRTVWLEPEEQQEPRAPQLTPRRHKRTVAPVWHGPIAVFSMIAVVAVMVGCIVVYVNSQASIARYEYQRQKLTAEIRQLDNDCARLSMDVARLENTPKVLTVAKAYNLEFPSTDRVHYVKNMAGYPQPVIARTVPRDGQPSWLARTGSRMIAKLDSAFSRIGRGPGTPAYAR